MATQPYEELTRLSEEADSLADFLRQARALLGISWREASLAAGLSAGSVWNITSGTTLRGDAETITKLARYFNVPAGNLLRLAGYDVSAPSSHHLREAQAIYDTLTDEELKQWLQYGHMIIRARVPPTGKDD